MADVGCGIALDAQALIQAGYEVDGYDPENPSLAYARGRLARDLPGTGRVGPITQLPGRRYPLAYAVDVIGHASDPLALIELVLSSAEHVAINFRHTTPGTATAQPICIPRSTISALCLSSKSRQCSAQLLRAGTVITLWRSSHS